jgi:hypothetical protein
VRHAALLVEFDNGGLSVGPKLGRGGTQGSGGLQWMPTLHTAVAAAARANVDVELAVNWSTWNLDLVLLVDVCLFDRPTAIRTNVRQFCLVGFVDLLGLRRLAVGLGAVIPAGFTAGLFRLGLGWSLGEWRSLAFAGATLFVEEARELCDLSAEFGVLPLDADTSFARQIGHLFTVAAAFAFSCASLPRKWAGERERR